MKPTNLYSLLFSLLLFSQNYFAQQKVGLVLSGGGATGLAHVGVLKALEENDIPIDYITGTSAGALVGSMYAAGYSPEEIEAYILSEDFQLMAYGEIHADQHFLLNKPSPDAGLIGISLSQDSLLKKSLPTNFTSSSLLDFQMMRLLGPVSATYGNDFNKLFIPFRCVASDIANKKSVVFESGHLNAAVRASMTYPFYFKSIKIDNTLLFDGGLYNNFPADVMYSDFNPDYIIGSNVSYNADLPDEDDIISQLTNMLVSYTDFALPCEEGLLIEPKPDVSAFDFKNVKETIDVGYQSTLLKIDSLKMHIASRRSKEEVEKRRRAFRSRIPELSISSVQATADKKKLIYSGKSMMKKRKPEILDAKTLEKRYFRLNSIPQIDFVYPTLELNSDSTYRLGLELRKAKEIRVKVGGHISSRPVNTGYVGLSYQTTGKVLTNTKLETYFGKFYGSAKAEFTLRIPTVYPFTTTAYFTLNRWDYFRSFATFFEDVKPSFLVQNEIYTGLSVSSPFGNTIKNTVDFRYFQLDDVYYQTDNFSNKDTADITTFSGVSTSWGVTQNSLNRIQFASSGHLFAFKARYVYGREHSTSGTTAEYPYDIKKYHSWVNLKLDYQSFIIDKPVFHLGLHGQLVYNSHPLFANYTATLLSMTEFSLIPDAKTYFLPEYRSPQFASGGLNTIFTIKKKIDIRLDAYIYQPFIQVIKNADGTQELSKLFEGRTYMASSSIIYHSYIGPIRLTLNYFPEQINPLAFQFSIGYVLFNERAIR